MVPNWRVVVVSVATLAVLAAGAWRGAFSWHVPMWFALGVVMPAFGVRVKLGSGPTSNPPNGAP